MGSANFLTITDQVAEYLRAGIAHGRWSGTMPGKNLLASELGVNAKTVEGALRQLERSEFLLPQGTGRNRLINPQKQSGSRLLRVALLLHEFEENQRSELCLKVTHVLNEAGHNVVIAEKSLDEIRYDPKRVASLVQLTQADAWIVFAGSSPVLEWFAHQSIPAFALFGNRAGVKLPSIAPNKPAAVQALTEHLVSLGHRRIVLMVRKVHRSPQPTASLKRFIDVLQASGGKVGDYHLPDWEETNEGFQSCLHSLFNATPPTALIVDEVPFFVAAMQFLLRNGLKVPDDVSLVSTDDDVAFTHCHPSIACITWDRRPIFRRLVKWVSNISRGKQDLAQSHIPAEFIPGGTVGHCRSEVFSKRAIVSI